MRVLDQEPSDRTRSKLLKNPRNEGGNGDFFRGAPPRTPLGLCPRPQKCDLGRQSKRGDVVIRWLLCVTKWLRRGYFVVEAWLLCGYLVVTGWLLGGYWVVTGWLLGGYWVVTGWLFGSYDHA